MEGTTHRAGVLIPAVLCQGPLLPGSVARCGDFPLANIMLPSVPCHKEGGESLLVRGGRGTLSPLEVRMWSLRGPRSLLEWWEEAGRCVGREAKGAGRSPKSSWLASRCRKLQHDGGGRGRGCWGQGWSDEGGQTSPWWELWAGLGRAGSPGSKGASQVTHAGRGRCTRWEPG